MRRNLIDDESGRLAALRRYAILDTGSEPAFDRITELVRITLDVPMAAVSLIDAQRQWFKSRQGIDVCETPRSVSFCAHAIRDCLPLVVADARHDERFSTNPLVLGAPHIRAYLGIPLTTQDGYTLGALCAIDLRPRRFDATGLKVMETLAELVMGELELRQIAGTDDLTGVLSRRAFIREAEKTLLHRDRHGGPACLALVDLDHFKAVNDSHGHAIGDRFLQAIAGLAVETMRPGDVIGRLGGEEFAILMPETDERQAMEQIGRLREAVSRLVVQAPGHRLSVTASFGLAPLDERTSDVRHWLERADAALYRAKRSGRNRCVATAA